jgi:uncharacterized secreted protein with C-terminal beta-propeller domain
MNFLISNPVIAFIVLILLGFVVYTGTILFNEVVLNKDLKARHKQMRITTAVKGIKSRVVGLTTATLVPMAIIVAFVVVGSNTATVNVDKNLLSISSSQDIFEIYEDFNQKLNSRSNGWLPGINFTDDMVSAPEMSFDGAEADYQIKTTGSGSEDYSETNNQVIGVDEMDNVLTDGKFIYTMTYNTIQITFAGVMVGDEFDASQIGLYKTFEYSTDSCTDDQFYPQGMFVDEDRLIVIGNQYNYYCEETKYEDGEPMPDIEVDFIDTRFWGGYQSSSIKVLVYDISDDFSLEDEYSMDGYFTGTRKIGDSLYIVTNNHIPFYLEDINLDDYLPTYEVNGIEVAANYEDIVYVDGTSPNSFTTFYGIDLDTTDVDMEVILGDSGYNLYVSNENMYLVGTNYYFWPIFNTLIDTVTTEETTYDSKTAILKVSIGDAEVEYEALGLITGNTLNQFSMDEYEGNLRITTTEGWWGEEINNRLYILDENLKVVSMLENLGKVGETIKSTRFVGDYAYLVTFEQTDPFYVINVSDPENPVVEGELIIPGYSAYLQPLGENYILGIGYGDSDGGTAGIKIAIFDVSDKSNPVVLGEEVIFDYAEHGWSSSSAIYNHKDLLISVEKGIIALPFSTSSYHEKEGYTFNSGILVYNFNFTTGLDYSGFVQHELDSKENVYVYKSKFISEYFYTISNKYIKVSTLLDVEEILYSSDLPVEYYGTDLEE